MTGTLKRTEILRRKTDLEPVLRKGQTAADAALRLRFRPQPETAAPGTPSRRVAFLLSRRVRGAVRRNRLKRRLREVYRCHKDAFPDGFDYAFQAGPDAAALSFADLRALTLQLAGRLAGKVAGRG
ncbi:ribonuclease P protein component [candidate division WOR-3 bacterium]|nr:ribonuclease P protein component [candidate division WOR-3 bacterium]